jgi:hypothetical protein
MHSMFVSRSTRRSRAAETVRELSINPGADGPAAAPLPAARRTMVTQLLEKERIRTTLAKAKTLQRYAEQIITLGKQVRNPQRSAATPRHAAAPCRTPIAV